MDPLVGDEWTTMFHTKAELAFELNELTVNNTVQYRQIHVKSDGMFATWD